MPVGSRDSYLIRGAHPEAQEASLEAALVELLMYWDARRPLAVHAMGNLYIELSVGGHQVKVEITSLGVLDDFQYGVGPKAILDELARATGLPQADAMSLIEKASAYVRVDAIRVPTDPNAWQPEPGLEVERVMPDAAVSFLRERLQILDSDEGRERGRQRRGEARHLVDVAVRIAKDRSWSDAELSRRTDIPRSTIRDARRRAEGATRIKQAAPKEERRVVHQPRQRLTDEDRKAVLRAIERHGGNAAEAARSLGLPERTVRDVRASASRRAPDPVPESGQPRERKRQSYGDDVRDRLLDLVKSEGLTATEAARKLGVKDRTARDWVRDARKGRK